MDTSELLARAKEDLAEMARLVEMIETLPELEEIASGFVSGPRSLILAAPMNGEVNARNRQALKEAGWEAETPSMNDETGVVVSGYKKDGKKITLLLEPYLPGSTCTRRPIGKKEVTIYEITCKETANDPA